MRAQSAQQVLFARAAARNLGLLSCWEAASAVLRMSLQTPSQFLTRKFQALHLQRHTAMPAAWSLVGLNKTTWWQCRGVFTFMRAIRLSKSLFPLELSNCWASVR